MPVTLTVKQVPDELVERLRKRAEQHHRSLQGELITILEQAVMARPLTWDEADARLKAWGVRTSGSSAEIVRELRDGR